MEPLKFKHYRKVNENPNNGKTCNNKESEQNL